MVGDLDRLARLERERRKKLGPVLTEAILKEHFPDEFKSWETVRRRCQRGEYKLDPAFGSFVNFMLALGPRPTPEHNTVDRMDPRDPVYGPGRVRWATRKQQTANRTNAAVIRDPITRVVYSFQFVADLQGIDRRTLFRHREAGWTDAELLAGYECPTLARLAEQVPPPASASTVAVADQPAQPQAWSELPRFDRLWADIKDRMLVMSVAELTKLAPWDGEPDQALLEEGYRHSAEASESRFAFAYRMAVQERDKYGKYCRWIEERLPQPLDENHEPELTDQERVHADRLANDFGPKLAFWQDRVMRRHAQLQAWKAALLRAQTRDGVKPKRKPAFQWFSDDDDDDD